MNKFISGFLRFFILIVCALLLVSQISPVCAAERTVNETNGITVEPKEQTEDDSVFEEGELLNATTPQNVSISDALSRINKLASTLKGLYFTTTGKTCHTPWESGHPEPTHDDCNVVKVTSSSWFKQKVDLVPDWSAVGSVYHYTTSGNKITNGWSCAGFASFAGWYVYAQKATDKVTFTRIYTGSDSKAQMSTCRPGDILRSSAGHSTVFIQNLSNGTQYQVLDCNWNFNSSDGNCKINVRSVSYGSNTVAISRASNSVETTDTYYTTEFYANKSGVNYMVNTDFITLDEEHYQSRDTATATLSVDTVNTHNGYNSLKIVNAAAGSDDSHDLAFFTTLQGRQNAGFVGETKDLTLSFWAKSSTNGAKMYFRWGFGDIGSPVTFSTSWQKYTISISKTPTHNGWLHPFVDSVGTVWISEMQLEDGTSSTAYVPENESMYASTNSLYGGKYSLPSNPTRLGYTFDGWYTARRGGTQVTSSTSVMKGNLILYAHWKLDSSQTYFNTEFYENRSGVNYVVNSDFATLDEEHYQSRDTETATISVDSSNTHNGYNSLKIVNSISGNEHGHDLAFFTSTRANELSGGYGESKNMMLSFWAKSSKSGTGLYWRWGFNTDVIRSVSLTTSWKKYTVPMDKSVNDGAWMHPYADSAGTVWIAELQLEDGTAATEFVPENESLYATTSSLFGDTYVLPSPNPARTGYTFKGWYTARRRGSQVTSSTSVLNGDMVLYGQWTVASYTVTFDANGGSVSAASKSVTYGHPYGALPTPTREGYTFDGWFTSATGGTKVTADTKVTAGSNHTLYAHWNANTYTVTFDANGGSVSAASKSVTYGQPYGALPTPTRNGYEFDGWFTSASGGTEITSSTTVTTAGAHTLYAHWTEEAPKTVTVIFDGNGGTVSSSSMTATVGSPYGTLPTATRTGYTFDGWFTSATGGTQVTASTIVTNTNTHTLYAHWKENEPEADKIEEFVRRLYRLCLNREADAGGLANWCNLLRSGQRTAAQVVQGFFNSAEMKKLNLPNEEFIERCYLVMMDRAGDAGGKANWIKTMDSGVSNDYILRGFVHSNEFTGICSDYGIERGSITLTEARDQNLGITQFVSRCYSEVLGRKADKGGLNNWCNKILTASNKKQAAINMASNGFFHSREYLNMNSTDDEYVRTLYRTFFGREADTGGYNNWMNKLASGTSRDTVLMGFANSREFANIMAKYGIK